MQKKLIKFNKWYNCIQNCTRTKLGNSVSISISFIFLYLKNFNIMNIVNLLKIRFLDLIKF